MNRSEQEKLLREILAEENLDRVRADSLATMLQVARRRRHRRQFAGSAAAAAVLVLAALTLFRRDLPPPAEVAAMPGPPPVSARVKVIDDEQLLALFPGRPVALVGAPGDQRLLILDGATVARDRSER